MSTEVMVALIGAAATIAAAFIAVRHKRAPDSELALFDEPSSSRDDEQYFYVVLERGKLVSGSASIFVEGHLIGSLRVGPGYLEDQLTIPIPRNARLKYEIRGKVQRRVVVVGSNEEAIREFPAKGQGVIAPRPGEIIALVLNCVSLEGPGVGAVSTAFLQQGKGDLKAMLAEFDSLVLGLLEDPDMLIIGSAALGTQIEKCREAMSLTAVDVANLTSGSLDAMIEYLIRHQWISEPVAYKYRAMAPIDPA